MHVNRAAAPTITPVGADRMARLIGVIELQLALDMGSFLVLGQGWQGVGSTLSARRRVATATLLCASLERLSIS